jgi:hypothetical protein
MIHSPIGKVSRSSYRKCVDVSRKKKLTCVICCLSTSSWPEKESIASTYQRHRGGQLDVNTPGFLVQPTSFLCPQELGISSGFQIIMFDIPLNPGPSLLGTPLYPYPVLIKARQDQTRISIHHAGQPKRMSTGWATPETKCLSRSACGKDNGELQVGKDSKVSAGGHCRLLKATEAQVRGRPSINERHTCSKQCSLSKPRAVWSRKKGKRESFARLFLIGHLRTAVMTAEV